MTDTVVAFSRYNLASVPDSLEVLAHQLREEGKVRNVVMAIIDEDGATDYRVFGKDPFTKVEALGLLERCKFNIMGV